MIRDLALRVCELPREQLIKAQTLGASTWQIALRVVLPQILPRLIDSLRLQLGPAWLFLIAAEAIASDSGLGYRIFLVRRYLAMDVILPYVAWITLLAFADGLLRCGCCSAGVPLVRGGEGAHERDPRRERLEGIWRPHRARAHHARRRAARLRRAGRPVRLRQDHLPAHAARRGDARAAAAS